MHSVAGRTARSEHLYGDPGTVYVYICYGMHHLFNVITNKKDIPHGCTDPGTRTHGRS